MRSVLRWGVGTLVLGSALLLIDIAFYHLWSLRRPRLQSQEWHLQILVGTGLAGLLLAALGVYLLRRWSSPRNKG